MFLLHFLLKYIDVNKVCALDMYTVVFTMLYCTLPAPILNYKCENTWKYGLENLKELFYDCCANDLKDMSISISNIYSFPDY